MNRVRTRSPVYVRQKSISSSTGASPMMSPMHRHMRSGSIGVGNSRRPQNNAAKAAAQRLAQVMAHQQTDDEDDDDDDDMSVDYEPLSASSSSIGIAAGRAMKPPSPRSLRSLGPPSPRAARSPSPALGRNFGEHTPTVRSTSSGRPAISVMPPALVSTSKPSLRPISSPHAAEPPAENRRDKRHIWSSADMGNFNIREAGKQRSTSALQDELDMVQEENESIVEKLRLAEERYEEAEARARQLEKQAALKAAAQTNGVGNEEIAALRLEAETARDEAVSSVEQLQEAWSEIRSLRAMTQRMVLTEEEMEEVVLKRCWLARYWRLCVQHDIHADIAGPKHEYWSSLAPLPLEVVLAAGRKAKEEFSTEKGDMEERDKVQRDLNDLNGEGNIESMLLVEKGLRELVSLKVEDAVVLAMAQHRRPNSLRHGHPNPDAELSKLAIEGQNLLEAFELSQEESEDVHFKQAWLTYFWRRAKSHGLEEDIADERLQFWINQSSQPPTSHDAVSVERGLMELRKLGIETQLWEAPRKGMDDTTY
ncbi:coiled-coil domain-containing protein SCD2-like isoform X2 [Magnolia sinica]|uniref:coiled-coil domain-containing protein SCD2-like isoform X2 n=1 Tax=Magnolia sinica TaxID=86752 RepID=UPI00265A5E30|nr:coiled-coil domain-containing protein SCD2-like isoform X2 [Magnolia sinica]